jgi:D-sedoheptulose 7-phosphate isomerase
MISWQKYALMHQPVLSEEQAENSDTLTRLGNSLVESSKNDHTIVFTAGNGGSATTAEHFSADLSQTKKRTGNAIRSICLNSPLGINSALSNDLSYEEALATQLKNFNPKSNLLVVFSASGNSKNIINLLNFANSERMESWAFLGFDGGQIMKMKQVNKILFREMNRNYGLVENIHLMACHFLIDFITEAIAPKS